MTKGVYFRQPRGTYNRLSTVYGVGKITPGIHPRTNEYPAYVAWHNMLRRCYKGDMATYTKQEVCNEWLDYQTFADWFILQQGAILGWEVDKDLLSTSSVYSPENCILLPGRLNKVLIVPNKTELPTGVQKCKSAYRVRVRDIKSKAIHIGVFSTIEEALKAYRIAKQKVLSELALLYMDCLDARAFNKLTNYYTI